MKNEPVTASRIIIERTMNYRGVPVLHYRIEYPRFRHPFFQTSLDGINEWYRAKAAELQKEYERELYREAAGQYRYSRENNFPFHMYDAVAAYEITNEKDNVLSLYYDRYVYSGGAHGNTIRSSETWNYKDGCRLSLFQYTDDPVAFQEKILRSIRIQIEAQTAKGENMYFDDYPQLIVRYFNPDHFYITPQGLVIYYQQYEIAPYASGIPQFLIRFQ